MYVGQPKDELEFREAVELILESPGRISCGIEEQVNSLISYTNKLDLTFEHCLIGKEKGRMLGACLCVDLPGRISNIYVPHVSLYDERMPDVIVRLLLEAVQLARERDVKFLQGIVQSENEEMAAVYGSAGFQYLAQLIYLKRDLSKQVFLCRDPYICDWQTYNTQTHQLFAQVIQGTYQDSLDCHLLSGRRDIEDVLASHRSIGRFDHRYWMIGMVNGEPIGVILLSFLPEQDSCEVVYIGVLPAWRRQGYGSALLGLAFEIVRETGTSALTLTVDAKNTPAQKLYRNFGFRELIRRDVWIKFV